MEQISTSFSCAARSLTWPICHLLIRLPQSAPVSPFFTRGTGYCVPLISWLPAPALIIAASVRKGSPLLDACYAFLAPLYRPRSNAFLSTLDTVLRPCSLTTP